MTPEQITALHTAVQKAVIEAGRPAIVAEGIAGVAVLIASIDAGAAAPSARVELGLPGRGTKTKTKEEIHEANQKIAELAAEAKAEDAKRMALASQFNAASVLKQLESSKKTTTR